MITLTEIRKLNISVDDARKQPLHISAASGLVRVGSTIYVVADDELHLGMFSATAPEPGRLIRLFDGVLPVNKAKRKRQKPDLEALTLIPAIENFPHGALVAFGSGSRPNRGRGALLSLDPLGAVFGAPKELDMSPILGPLYDAFAELNIEGAVVVGDELRMFQRGNKRHSENAIIRYPLSQVLNALLSAHGDPIEPSSISRLSLDSIGGVPFCFTDAAALRNGDMVFSAVAEDTEDAYRDGPSIGAAIGIIDNDGHLLSLQRLDRPYKVEGICVQQDGDRLALMLVTDADNPTIPGMLLSTSFVR